MVLGKISSQICAAIETVEKKLDSIIVSMKGIREELVITVGVEFAGTGAKQDLFLQNWLIRLNPTLSESRKTSY